MQNASKLEILHLYTNSPGIAGSYINYIFNALKENFCQDMIVNYYYPYPEGKKIFFRFSELSHPNLLHKFNLLRLSVRYLEMCIGLVYCYIFIKKYSPKVINYSLTTQVNLELVFLRCIKAFTDCKLYLTVHDVIPFETLYSCHKKDIKKRQLFFNLSDKLILHNRNSLDDLQNHYEIDASKILMCSFPVMRPLKLRQVGVRSEVARALANKQKIFSFIGHLRKEKGIHVLIDAWHRFMSINGNSKEYILLIAGNIPSGFCYNFDKLNGASFTLVPYFLSDLEYQNVIAKSYCVILPYTSGSNSGIPSTVLSMGTRLITSDINMFRSNVVIDKKYMFKNGDSHSLADIISELIEQEEYDFKPFLDYEKKLAREIKTLYFEEFSNKC